MVTCIVAWFSPKVDYASDHFPNCLSFLFTAVAGSFAICYLSMGIEHSRILAHIGTRTLAILVMHKFPILLFQTVGPLKNILSQYDSAGGIIFALVVSIIAIVMCIVAEKIIEYLFPFMLGHFHKKHQDI